MNKEEITKEILFILGNFRLSENIKIKELTSLYMKQQHEIERLNNIINEQDKELELERKSRQLLTDDLANVCEMSLKKENIIKEAIKYIKSYMPNYDFDKTNLIKLLEILQGSDKE